MANTCLQCAIRSNFRNKWKLTGLLSNAYNKYLIKTDFRGLNTKTYDWLKFRGILKTSFPDKNETITELLSTRQTLYAGFDPTSDSLHVGNLLVLLALFHLYRAGHRIIILIGESTARIGDPSDKLNDRDRIDKEIIKTNAIGIENGVRRIFENYKKYFIETKSKNKDDSERLIICSNTEWYSNKNVIDFISDFGPHLRMGDMLCMSSIKRRIESPSGLNLCEFTYPLFQSYDWLNLYQRYGCIFQVGGIDQIVNIHNGHDLIKKLTGAQTYGLFVPLLESASGKKFGKSEENTAYLNSEKSSPYKLYQFFLSLQDTEMSTLFKLFSLRSDDEIEQMLQKQLVNPEPWYLQKKLGTEITRLVHGEDGLISAKKTTAALFNKDLIKLGSLSKSEINDVFEGVSKSVRVFDVNKITILDLAMMTEYFPDQRQALSMIQRGGFYINYTKVSQPNQILTEDDILPNDITIVSVGKRQHHVIKWH